MIPDDYLVPITRLSPSHRSNVMTVALDPREAAFVLDRGWATIDGVRWRVTLNGWDGLPQSDGRVVVRLDLPAEEPLRLPEQWGEAAPAPEPPDAAEAVTDAERCIR